MGIFSTNRYNSAESNDQMMFEAAEGYHGDIGFAIAAIESYQNDMAIFNGVISSDFQEATLVREGASAEEVYILQEGVLSNAWEKIKEFFKKLWEKIKGIFKAFFAKAEGALSKDTKSFYNKYEDAINKKNLADFEVKCRVPKNKDVVLRWNGNLKFDVNDSVSKEELDDFDEEEYFETRSNTTTGIRASKKEYEEKYFEAVFEEENDVKFSASDLTGTDSWVKEALTNTNRLGAIKQANKDLENTIAKIIGMIDDEIKKVKKADGNKKYKDDYQKVDQFRGGSDNTGVNARSISDESVEKDDLKGLQRSYEYTKKRAVATQSIVLSYSHATIKAYQFFVSQARKVYAAAAAYNPKEEAKQEANILAAAVGDVAFTEAWEAWSDYSTVDDDQAAE